MRFKEHVAWVVSGIALSFVCAFGAERVVTYDTVTGKTKATVSNSAQLEAAIGPIASAETDPIASAVSGILKSNGTTLSAASSGTDYAPATVGTSILKASSGGFANASAGTDYMSPANVAAFTGSTNIATVGTVTTGTWSATAIADTRIANAATFNAKADYEFGANNFNGTGNFTSAGIGQFLSIKQTGITQVSAYGNGNQTFSDDSWTKVEIQNESLDTLNEYDSVTNYRFTATKNANYLVYGVLSFEGMADGKDYFCAINVNGTRVYINGSRTSSPVSTTRAIISVFSIFSLTIGQYLEFEGYQNNGGSINSSTGQFTPHFYVQALNQN